MLRQQAHLKSFVTRYPNIWKAVDRFRFERRKAYKENWPEWCFIPLEAAVDVLTEATGVSISGLSPDSPFLSKLVHDAQRLATLAAWRTTQGIYRFDEELFRELTDTPITEELPIDVFFCLPEWCVYVEMPDSEELARETELKGFYCCLDWSAKDGIPEIRFLLDFGSPDADDLACLILPLKSKSLSENLTFYKESIEKTAAGMGKTWESAGFEAITLDFLRICLPPIIYICSVGADIRPVGSNRPLPHKPSPKKTKKGLRFFPPPAPVVWEMGFRVGATLREARRQAGETASGEPKGKRKSPIPHVRRAHWHHYWTGPRKGDENQRKLVVKWIPPVFVNFPEDEKDEFLIPVVRKVKK